MFIQGWHLNKSRILYSCRYPRLATEQWQEEKFTDKGIPEVDIVSIRLIDGGGALFEGMILVNSLYAANLSS
ncbi:MAG: hypothetical protein L0Y37_06335 [Bacteroidales bacterium]|nr:hypothetical protein [Bacteroidales bacterium]